MIENLVNIHIKPWLKTKCFGCDGDLYELKLGDMFNNACYKWWEKGPDEWNELTSYIEGIVKYHKYMSDK